MVTCKHKTFKAKDMKSQKLEASWVEKGLGATERGQWHFAGDL